MIKIWCFLYLLIISICDIKWQRIPNLLTGVFFIAMIFVNLFASPLEVPKNLLQAFCVLVIFFIVLVSTNALGGGDVKLAGALGYALGVLKVSLIFLIASGVGLIAFLILKNDKKKSFTKCEKLPFAPFVFCGYILQEFFIL